MIKVNIVIIIIMIDGSRRVVVVVVEVQRLAVGGVES